jgi:hypothetical protein
LSWRWSQYIVAIIDGVVLILLFATFEETLFPRFLFSSSLPFAHSGAASEVDFDGKKLNAANMTSVANNYNFPKRTLVERLQLWSFYPEDRTTYWQYFRRPFFLLSFPNVIIVSWPNCQGCTTLTD